MVYMHFPTHLTEEEEMLQKKYAKLKKKKRALAQLRAPKPQVPPPASEKRPHEAASDNTEQAKKLIKLGAIKVEVEKKDHHTFKRSKRQKETEKTAVAVGFQPYASESSDREEEPRSEAGRSKVKNLYDSFVTSREPRPDREDRHDREERPPRRERERDRERERERDRELPRKGNTIYVYGHGVTEDLFRKAFSNFGTIVNVSMELEKNCGFVTFEKMESSEQAIVEMNGSMVSGCQMKVSLARRQPTFEQPSDQPNSSWASIAASNSQKGTHKDKRDLIAYDEEDMF